MLPKEGMVVWPMISSDFRQSTPRCSHFQTFLYSIIQSLWQSSTPFSWLERFSAGWQGSCWALHYSDLQSPPPPRTCHCATRIQSVNPCGINNTPFEGWVHSKCDAATKPGNNITSEEIIHYRLLYPGSPRHKQPTLWLFKTPCMNVILFNPLCYYNKCCTQMSVHISS